MLMKRGSICWRIVCVLTLAALVGTIVLLEMLRVRSSEAALLGLPAPDRMVGVSPAQSLPFLRGVRLDANNPLQLEFIVDKGSASSVKQDEVATLIRYFLAGLTVPEDQLWVNLSPYESDRVIDEEVAATDLGRGLLEQDYLLKQLASSLTHPDTPTGEAYWRVENGKSTIENRLGKIWIVPDRAEIYEQGTTAVITEARLKLQCEDETQQVLLPEITRDVNEGRNFAKLRQIYHSTILAAWFKKKFEASFYAKYFDNEKMAGIDTSDPAVKERVYKLYCEAFKKGVYDVLRTSADGSQSKIQGKRERRRYFSGGVLLDAGSAITAAADLSKLGASPTYTTFTVAASALEQVRSTVESGPERNARKDEFVGLSGSLAVELALTPWVEKGVKTEFSGAFDFLRELGSARTDKYADRFVVRPDEELYMIARMDQATFDDFIAVFNRHNAELARIRQGAGGKILVEGRSRDSKGASSTLFAATVVALAGVYVLKRIREVEFMATGFYRVGVEFQEALKKVETADEYAQLAEEFRMRAVLIRDKNLRSNFVRHTLKSVFNEVYFKVRDAGTAKQKYVIFEHFFNTLSVPYGSFGLALGAEGELFYQKRVRGGDGTFMELDKRFPAWLHFEMYNRDVLRSLEDEAMRASSSVVDPWMIAAGMAGAVVFVGLFAGALLRAVMETENEKDAILFGSVQERTEKIISRIAEVTGDYPELVEPGEIMEKHKSDVERMVREFFDGKVAEDEQLDDGSVLTISPVATRYGSAMLSLHYREKGTPKTLTFAFDSLALRFAASLNGRIFVSSAVNEKALDFDTVDVRSLSSADLHSRAMNARTLVAEARAVDSGTRELLSRVLEAYRAKITDIEAWEFRGVVPGARGATTWERQIFDAFHPSFYRKGMQEQYFIREALRLLALQPDDGNALHGMALVAELGKAVELAVKDATDSKYRLAVVDAFMDKVFPGFLKSVQQGDRINDAGGWLLVMLKDAGVPVRFGSYLTFMGEDSSFFNALNFSGTVFRAMNRGISEYGFLARSRDSGDLVRWRIVVRYDHLAKQLIAGFDGPGGIVGTQVLPADAADMVDKPFSAGSLTLRVSSEPYTVRGVRIDDKELFRILTEVEKWYGCSFTVDYTGDEKTSETVTLTAHSSTVNNPVDLAQACHHALGLIRAGSSSAVKAGGVTTALKRIGASIVAHRRELVVNVLAVGAVVTYQMTDNIGYFYGILSAMVLTALLPGPGRLVESVTGTMGRVWRMHRLSVMMEERIALIPKISADGLSLEFASVDELVIFLNRLAGQDAQDDGLSGISGMTPQTFQGIAEVFNGSYGGHARLEVANNGRTKLVVFPADEALRELVRKQYDLNKRFYRLRSGQRKMFAATLVMGVTAFSVMFLTRPGVSDDQHFWSLEKAVVLLSGLSAIVSLVHAAVIHPRRIDSVHNELKALSKEIEKRRGELLSGSSSAVRPDSIEPRLLKFINTAKVPMFNEIGGDAEEVRRVIKNRPWNGYVSLNDLPAVSSRFLVAVIRHVDAIESRVKQYRKRYDELAGDKALVERAVEILNTRDLEELEDIGIPQPVVNVLRFHGSHGDHRYKVDTLDDLLRIKRIGYGHVTNTLEAIRRYTASSGLVTHGGIDLNAVSRKVTAAAGSSAIVLPDMLIDNLAGLTFTFIESGVEKDLETILASSIGP